jgi:hypothetical protein
MSNLENEILNMMCPKEAALLLRVLDKSGPCRDGAIVAMVCQALREMDRTGLMAHLYPELAAGG